jgi:hypothetical protein
MGRVLHNWSLEQKLELLRKAYRALPNGGAPIVYESLIDDERQTNTFGLLLSVAMLLVTHDGSGYTGAQCRSWMSQAGFRDSYINRSPDPTRWSSASNSVPHAARMRPTGAREPNPAAHAVARWFADISAADHVVSHPDPPPGAGQMPIGRCRAHITTRRTADDAVDARALFGVRSRMAVRRLANPVALSDGQGVFFVAASGQIRLAANSARRSLSLSRLL